MINQNEPNVQLTFEQLQRIDVAQKRLTNLQNESAAASKILTEVRLDTDRITKEKDYQQSLLDIINQNIATAKVTLEKLQSDIAQNDVLLRENTARANTVGVENDAKKAELKDKQDSLDKSEEEYRKNKENYIIQSKALEKEKEDIAKAKQILSDAINAIPWK